MHYSYTMQVNRLGPPSFVIPKTKSGIELAQNNIHTDSHRGQAGGRCEALTPRVSHQLRHYMYLCNLVLLYIMYSKKVDYIDLMWVAS